MSLARTRAAILASAVIGMAVVTGAGATEEPSDENGRYTLSPVEGGFLRLDTRSGNMSLCTKAVQSWACEPVKNSGGSVEALQEENNALREHIKSLEEGMAANNGGTENGYPTEPPAGSMTQLPTEKEIDQAFDYVERMYKKLRDRIERFDNGPKPKADSGSGTGTENGKGSGAL